MKPSLRVLAVAVIAGNTAPPYSSGKGASAMRITTVIVLALLASLAHSDSYVLKHSLWTNSNLVQLVGNGGLEQVGADGFESWMPCKGGYDVDSRVAHAGRSSAVLRNTTPGGMRGLRHAVELNQQVATPVIASCWSKANNVSCGDSNEYCLYVDGNYIDGTHVNGRWTPLASGTHDWQPVTVTLVPRKPLKSLLVYGLFRQRTGTAWFDDFQLWSAPVPTNAWLFDGFPVVQAPATGSRPTPTPFMKTDDGLPLCFDVQTGQVCTDNRGGLFLHDVVNRSDFVQPRGVLQPLPGGGVTSEGQDEALGLKVSATYRSMGQYIRIDGQVADLTGKDRAVTVYFTYPVDAVGWAWHDDQRVARQIEAGHKYYNCEDVQPGANWKASRYPFACISGSKQGLALGAPLAVPRLCRFGYDASSRELYAAIDLGLSPAVEKSPSQATFSLLLYQFDPQWGFRAALQKYYDLFPQCFTKRNKKEGVWIWERTEYSAIKNWQDFGFQFREGGRELTWQAREGLYTFNYIEPMSMWLNNPEVRTKEAGLSWVKTLEPRNHFAGSILLDENGEPHGGSTDLPWCHGFFFTVNPSPYLPTALPDSVSKGEVLLRDIAYAMTRDSLPRHHAWEGLPSVDRAWQDGYTIDAGAGRNGGAALKEVRRDYEEGAVARQSVILNQAEPKPLTARVWTKAENVTDASDRNYGLFVDYEYTDGSTGGGIAVPAATGSHDWQLLEKTVTPKKPLRLVAYHLLLRAPHTGTVWFSDAYLGEEGVDRNLLAGGDCKQGPEDIPTQLDGTYMDCVDTWASSRNYNREHWKFADIPLTFDAEGRVCQWQLFTTVEFAREAAGRLWKQGKMTWGNGVPATMPWYTPWFDICAAEVLWDVPGGKYNPDSDAIMCQRRAMAYQRPFLAMIYTDNTEWSRELVERYMKRCVAYGFIPTFGRSIHNGKSCNYWDTPELYETDRPVFRRYIPVMKTLSGAGWEPITCARSDNARVYVERYGNAPSELFFTLFNDSDRPQTTTLTVDTTALGLDATGDAQEVLRNEKLPLQAGRLNFAGIGPGDVRVIALRTKGN